MIIHPVAQAHWSWSNMGSHEPMLLHHFRIDQVYDFWLIQPEVILIHCNHAPVAECCQFTNTSDVIGAAGTLLTVGEVMTASATGFFLQHFDLDLLHLGQSLPLMCQVMVDLFMKLADFKFCLQVHPVIVLAT